LEEKRLNNEIIKKEKLEEIVRQTRIKVVQMIGKSGFGHIGGSMSIVELLTVLYFCEMNIDPKNPQWEDRDRFVLSKGHSCLSLYAILTQKGYFFEEVLSTLDTVDSILQCHPDMKICPGIDMSTGALGQGISAAVGIAIGAKLKGKKFRTYSIVGDGELAEGQVWEAAMSAYKFKLDNLVVIIDYNKLTLSGKTCEVMPLEPLYDKWTSFGWHVIKIDGHSFAQIMDALNEAKNIKRKPTAIIANTIKGKGISFYENQVKSHSVTMSVEQVESALKELSCPQEEIEIILTQMKEEN
jgi:transketolase